MHKICCAFGHRDVFEKIEEDVYRAVCVAVEKGCTEFMTGSMGDFDSIFFAAVKRAKREHPNIKLVCVKPYLTKELQENKEYYSLTYDEIIIPAESAAAHYKSAITLRNKWMIDQCDIVILYTHKDYGGAYTAKKYALKCNKEIISL